MSLYENSIAEDGQVLRSTTGQDECTWIWRSSQICHQPETKREESDAVVHWACIRRNFVDPMKSIATALNIIKVIFGPSFLFWCFLPFNVNNIYPTKTHLPAKRSLFWRRQHCPAFHLAAETGAVWEWARDDQRRSVWTSNVCKSFPCPCTRVVTRHERLTCHCQWIRFHRDLLRSLSNGASRHLGVRTALWSCPSKRVLCLPQDLSRRGMAAAAFRRVSWCDSASEEGARREDCKLCTQCNAMYSHKDC